MSQSAADHSHRKMGNYLDVIINDVFVAQHVRNHLRRLVSTSLKIDRIVNAITTNSIILLAPNAVKELKDNVCNLKIPRFDILLVLFALYFPCEIADYRLVTLN
jgi:hypothetical protein